MDLLRDQLTYYWSRLTPNSIIDIALVTVMIYAVFVLIRGTRAVQLLRGLMVLAILFLLLSRFVELPAFKWLVSNTLPVLLLAFPVIFQPELRRALEQL